MKRLMFLSLAALSSLIGCRQAKGAVTELPCKTFTEVIATPGVQLIDVRSWSEFSEGHIPGAQNIDYQKPDFASRCEKLDKNHPVAIYCRSGHRSKGAAKTLSDKGFKVYMLTGGLNDWSGKVESDS